MSRSYKKNPWCREKGKKARKKLANSTVRANLKQNPECINFKGNSFKKLYEQWNVCEFNFFWPWNDYLSYHTEFYDSINKEICIKTMYKDWYKNYRRK